MFTALRFVLLSVAAGGLVLMNASPGAQAGRSPAAGSVLVLAPDGHVPRSAPVMCGPRDWKFTDGGRYILRNNVFVRSVRQCVTNAGDGNNFVVSRYRRTRPGLVGSYPDLFTGCDMWGVCTKDSSLPVSVSRLVRVRESWRTLFPADGQEANDSDDIWFTHGKLDGPSSSRAELMIWLTSTHVRANTIARKWIDHYRWRIAKWVTTNGKQDWNYLQFRVAHPRHRVTNLSIVPFIRYAESRGWIKPSWDMSSFDAGFEIWNYGRGDGITHYWVGVRTNHR
jgi:Glycosyl hydrolase family 12